MPQLSPVLKWSKPPSATLYTAQEGRSNQPHVFACQHGSVTRTFLGKGCMVPLNLVSIECSATCQIKQHDGCLNVSARITHEEKKHIQIFSIRRWKGHKLLRGQRSLHGVGTQVLDDGRTVIAQQRLFSKYSRCTSQSSQAWASLQSRRALITSRHGQRWRQASQPPDHSHKNGGMTHSHSTQR